MKIVLLQDIASLGKAGEVKEVADGHARNYLLPRGLAAPATAANVAMSESQRRALAQRQKHSHEALLESAGRLQGMEVRLQVRVGTEERLYGSVTASDIADELSRLSGLQIDKRNVELEEPIHRLGSYEVPVKLATDVVPKVRVIVEEAKPES